ncbi:MAG TPA: GNAT family N-acetyltransferase [Paracoccaceae bacterium]|nr:GNAT family N-acetyltransferase [Paracoccaceae bacterium]
MSLIVRPFGSEDEAVWRDLWSRYLAFYETSRSDDVYRITWARILDPEVPMHGRLALVERQPVGLVHWLYHPSFWDIAPRAYLNDLYVSEEARGKGVGRALIDTVYTHADERGAARVYWLTQEFNRTARTLYDRIGRATPFVMYTR